MSFLNFTLRVISLFALMITAALAAPNQAIGRKASAVKEAHTHSPITLFGGVTAHNIFSHVR
jgi:hypothetical protein